MNEVLFSLAAAGIFFAALGFRGLFGYLKNNKISDVKFDWKWFVSGALNPAVVILSIGGLVSLILAFFKIVDISGVEVIGLDQISPRTMLAGLFIADVTAIGYAIAAGLTLVGLSDKQIAQIRETAAVTAEDEKLGVEIKTDEDGNITALAVNVKQDAGDSAETEEGELAQLGAFPYYKVDVSSPAAFYNAVNGRGFNEGYGLQCVAGFKQFQYSLAGRIVATATGGASGYANQQAQIEALGFTRYTDNNLQDGDWVILGDGQYGHVAMYYQGKLFGQNQGAANSSVGNAFNLMNVGLGNYLCHYRPNIYKKAVNPAPSAPSASNSKPVDEAVIAAVKRGDYGNGATRVNNLTAAGYDAGAVQAAVNASLTQGSAAPASTNVAIGDRVRTSAKEDSGNGLALNVGIINDGRSVYAGKNSKGNAVLRIDSTAGTIRAAVPYESLSKV